MQASALYVGAASLAKLSNTNTEATSMKWVAQDLKALISRQKMASVKLKHSFLPRIGSFILVLNFSSCAFNSGG